MGKMAESFNKMKTKGNHGAEILSGTLLEVIYDCAKFQKVWPTGFSKNYNEISKKSNFYW